MLENSLIIIIAPETNQINPILAPNKLEYGLKTERRNKPNIGELVVLLNRKSSDNKVFLAIRKRLAYKIADLNPNCRTLANKEFPSIY